MITLIETCLLVRSIMKKVASSRMKERMAATAAQSRQQASIQEQSTFRMNSIQLPVNKR